MKIVDGYYVMSWMGGRYGSVAWYKEQSDANKECQRLLIMGSWSGMPPTVHPSFKEFTPCNKPGTSQSLDCTLHQDI